MPMLYDVFGSQNRAEASVAIIGAGPRGTSSLERIVASAPSFLKPHQTLKIHVVDDCAHGSGRVWRTNQPTDVVMNTVASQVTLFTDDSVVCEGPIRKGLSLHEWAKQEGHTLGPDAYPTRALYGCYLSWVYAEIQKTAPANVHILSHVAKAIRLDRDNDAQTHTLTLSTGKVITSLASVILSQGHVPLNLDTLQVEMTAYAANNQLNYIAPVNPADIDLSVIKPNESVFLRGLGLNFFDYMALFTLGRGGKFVNKSEGPGLRYIPSGREPVLYAGSRRGIPYNARADNYKGASGRSFPILLSEDVLKEFRDRADAGNPADFKSEIWPIISKELEYVYYDALLRQKGQDTSGFKERYITAFKAGTQSELLDQFNIQSSERFCWERLQNPYGNQLFSSADEWNAWLLPHLYEDAAQAKLGNLDGPLKSAIDMMRDLRNELRLIFDHDGVSGKTYKESLNGWYTPLNAYLSIGPPRMRVEQLIALIEAGVLQVVGPQVKVEKAHGAWTVRSAMIANSQISVTTLIEARLPEPNLRHTADDLLSHLMRTGQCRPHILDGYETGAIDITQSPYNIIDMSGRINPSVFAVGVPTEGVHWVTAAGARPGVNSITLCDTDAIARAALTRAKEAILVRDESAASKTVATARVRTAEVPDRNVGNLSVGNKVLQNTQYFGKIVRRLHEMRQDDELNAAN